MALDASVETQGLGIVIPDVDLLFRTGQFLKPSQYGDFGIPEYWVLDPEERCAWVWRFAAGQREPERIEGGLRWEVGGATEPLLIDLEKVLAAL